MIALDLHADTARLSEVLVAVPQGETVTLKALSRAIGRDVTRCRSLLYSAMKRVERESGVVFACVRTVGYRRLTSTELVKIGQTARSKIRRTARKGAKTIKYGAEKANDISDQDRLRLLSEQSALGLLEHMARDKFLPEVPKDEMKPLPIAVTARAFLESIGAIKQEA